METLRQIECLYGVFTYCDSVVIESEIYIERISLRIIKLTWDFFFPFFPTILKPSKKRGSVIM